MQKTSNNTFTACLTVLASVILASCSGGGDNVNGPQALGAASGFFVDLPLDTITQIGTVYLDIVDGEGFAEAGFPNGFSGGHAEFTDYGQTLSASTLVFQ